MTLLLELIKIPLVSTKHKESCNSVLVRYAPFNANNVCNLLLTLQ